MENVNLLNKVDHTLLLQTATWEEIRQICADGLLYRVASVCIPPSFVKKAKSYLQDKLSICTVIGFPNGYQTTAVKVFETKDAISNGADEIDMVVNLGDIKDKNYAAVLDEIKQIKAVCGDRILKVIIETCLLTEEEKIKMCEVVTLSGADFIKTSTGFSSAGATREDIALFSQYIGQSVSMKAAGGINSLQDAIDFVALGCKRLGTSKVVKLLKNEQTQGY